MNNIKHTLLKSVSVFFKYTKAHRLLQPIFKGRGVILVLHRVLPASAGPRISANSRIEITPEFLEKLIIFFQNKGYEIISLDAAYKKVSINKKGRPFVCFTFDDGYADAHEIIYPIFKKHQCPYTVYVITSFPEGDITLWWYMLEDLVLGHDSVAFTCNDQDYLFKTTRAEDKEQAYTTIRELILNTSKEQQHEVISAIFSSYNIRSRDYADRQLSWDQVIELSNDPLVTIGAHTVHHFNLKQLTAEQVKEEIATSKRILEEKTGKPVVHFAYPFGSRIEAGRREFDIARNCGFKTMTTVREGNIFPAHRRHFECLPRVEITGRHQDLTLVEMRLCGVASLLRNGWCRVVTE